MPVLIKSRPVDVDLIVSRSNKITRIMDLSSSQVRNKGRLVGILVDEVGYFLNR